MAGHLPASVACHLFSYARAKEAQMQPAGRQRSQRLNRSGKIIRRPTQKLPNSPPAYSFTRLSVFR